jgi:hypothetical protein
LLHAKVYGDVPPFTVNVTAPFDPPLQLTLEAVGVTVIAVGSVTVAVAVEVQVFASVTVTVYVFAVNPLLFWFVPPLLHAKVYGDVPPLTVNVTAPFDPPLQLTLEAVGVTVIAVGSVTVVVAVEVQEFASVTVTKCNPAENPVPVVVVTPLSHKKLYAPDPPLAVTVAVPLEPPKQLFGVEELVNVIPTPSVTVTEVLAEQPLASDAVTV